MLLDFVHQDEFFFLLRNLLVLLLPHLEWSMTMMRIAVDKGPIHLDAPRLSTNRAVRKSIPWMTKHFSPVVFDVVRIDREVRERSSSSDFHFQAYSIHSHRLDSKSIVHRTPEEIAFRTTSRATDVHRGRNTEWSSLPSSCRPLYVRYSFVHCSSIRHRCRIVRLRPNE